jgi:hypothetical protein
MWDWVLLAAVLTLTPATLLAVFNKAAYFPRITSGTTSVAVAVIAVSLFASGLPLRAAANVLGSLVWGAIFVMRGRKK